MYHKSLSTTFPCGMTPHVLTRSMGERLHPTNSRLAHRGARVDREMRFESHPPIPRPPDPSTSQRLRVRSTQQLLARLLPQRGSRPGGHHRIPMSPWSLSRDVPPLSTCCLGGAALYAARYTESGGSHLVNVSTSLRNLTYPFCAEPRRCRTRVRLNGMSCGLCVPAASSEGRLASSEWH